MSTCHQLLDFDFASDVSGDNWSKFSDTLETDTVSNNSEEAQTNVEVSASNGTAIDCNDLLDTFKTRISSHFKSDVNICITDENYLKYAVNLDALCISDDTWEKLTSNFGQVKLLNWETSSVNKCFLPTLNLDGKTTKKKLVEDDFMDVKLYQELDLHSINAYGSFDDVATNIQLFKNEQKLSIQSADEVIQELEEIMLDAKAQEEAFDSELQDATGIVISETVNSPTTVDDVGYYNESELKRMSVSSEEDGRRATNLKQMSFAELNAELSQIENTVKKLSQELLNELDLRDELKYINETRNALISKILEVQYKQEQFYKNNEQFNNQKKFGKLTKSFSSTATSKVTSGRFLTTVIPLQQPSVPNIEIMHVLIKILNAMKDDSDEVPGLLTTYILKVLVPAPVSTNTLQL